MSTANTWVFHSSNNLEETLVKGKSSGTTEEIIFRIPHSDTIYKIDETTYEIRVGESITVIKFSDSLYGFEMYDKYFNKWAYISFPSSHFCDGMIAAMSGNNKGLTMVNYDVCDCCVDAKKIGYSLEVSSILGIVSMSGGIDFSHTPYWYEFNVYFEGVFFRYIPSSKTTESITNAIYNTSGDNINISIGVPVGTSVKSAY